MLCRALFLQCRPLGTCSVSLSSSPDEQSLTSTLSSNYNSCGEECSSIISSVVDPQPISVGPSLWGCRDYVGLDIPHYTLHYMRSILINTLSTVQSHVPVPLIQYTLIKNNYLGNLSYTSFSTLLH